MAPRTNSVVVVLRTKPALKSPDPPQRWGAMPLDMMEGSVYEHKYKVGQSVSFTSGPFGRGGTNGVYKVTQLLPPEGDDYQYRIKNANEPHERVVKESQLDRIA
jgi:hypothetical protein